MAGQVYTFDGSVQKKGFHGCCGASILYGMSPDYDIGTYNRISPARFTIPELTQFTLGITNPDQEKVPCVVKSLGESGLVRLGTFMGAHGYELTLWGGGPERYQFQPNEELYGSGDDKKTLNAYKKELDKYRLEADELREKATAATDNLRSARTEVENLKRKLALKSKKLTVPKIRTAKTAGRTRLARTVRRGE